MKRLLVLLLILFASSPAAQELIMFEERGCHWCGRWNAEIAPIYPQTEEGRAAPLHRVDIALNAFGEASKQKHSQRVVAALADLDPSLVAITIDMTAIQRDAGDAETVIMGAQVTLEKRRT
ncbi:MAG: hypothetical protein AAF982_04135 [Pseudomonadota bacterium]